MKLKLLPLLVLSSSMLFSQRDYKTYDQLTSALKNLEKSSNFVNLSSIGKSYGNKDLWLVKLSKGTADKPALLITAGADGQHQAGTQIALLMLSKFISHPEMSNFLETKTVYILPNVSPDAMEAFFAKPQYERSGNARITDDNRNGRAADDAYEDLNKDGLITQMRIQSPKGQYIESEDDPRVLIKADPAKGQQGKYLLLTEGIDNNKNGLFNEDPGLGVLIDKNFAFDYPAFEKQAGAYAASESETRAIMDFVYSQPNIYAVLNLGMQNTLTEPISFDSKLTSSRIIKGWLEPDTKVSDLVSDFYKTHVGVVQAPKLPPTKGNLTQALYYHTGKFSFSTPGWWASATVVKDSVDTEKPKTKKEDQSEERVMINFLKWAAQEGIDDVFVSWATVSHPDFPNQKVEVGGIRPYALYNPPMKYLEIAAEKHVDFSIALLQAMPSVAFVNPKVEPLGNKLYRISVEVVNTGMMPTATAISDKIRFASRLKTTLILEKNQERMAGKKVQLTDVLQSAASETFTWLVSGSGKVTVTSGCATTGEISIALDLK